jgi:hypothetical protein
MHNYLALKGFYVFFKGFKDNADTPLHNLSLETHRYFCSGVFSQHHSRDGCVSLRGKKGYRRIYREPASSVERTQAGLQVKVTSFLLDGFMGHIC